jgi:hypothetical protein
MDMEVTSTPLVAHHGELPMLVWLRGDEPICAEFTLDADAVMAMLGIRRSRLTQISGKELRVGRMRRGRYVVPVFRPIDVEEYKAWSRAPATHLKSSSVLKEAADSLAEQSRSILDSFDEAAEKWLGVIDNRLTRLMSELLRQADHDGKARRIEIDRLRREFAEQDGKRHAAEAQWQARLTTLFDAMERQAAAGAVQARELAELGALVRLLRADAERRQSEMKEQLAGLKAPSAASATVDPKRRACVRQLLAQKRLSVMPSAQARRASVGRGVKPISRARVKSR